MGGIPHGIRAVFLVTLCTMKNNHRKKSLTLGEFIACVYDGCGKRKALGFVRLAIKSHMVEFRGHQRFVIS
jgi:hypothetical protein